MIKQENKNKCIFVVLHNNETYVPNYVTLLAKKLDLSLVYYIEDKKHKTEIEQIVLKIGNTLGVSIKICQKQIGFFSFLTSLFSIAKEENAEFICMNISKENIDSFGDNLWSKLQKNMIPIFLLPQKPIFEDYKNIVIAADKSMKVQKTSSVIRLGHSFASQIHIFKENSNYQHIQDRIDLNIKYIKRFLKEAEIPFLEIKAKKTEKFIKNLCKYAEANGNLLVVEVNPGKIDKETRINLEILLSYEKVILLKKTKETGIFTGNFR